jgi:hypothetical protein
MGVSMVGFLLHLTQTRPVVIPTGWLGLLWGDRFAESCAIGETHMEGPSHTFFS